MAGSGLKLYVVIDEYDNFTNTILAESRDQISRYAADHDLVRAWNLKPAGTVQLHRIVLVFHGGDVALAEDVVS